MLGKGLVEGLGWYWGLVCGMVWCLAGAGYGSGNVLVRAWSGLVGVWSWPDMVVGRGLSMGVW